MKKYIKINEIDNVIVALDNLDKGEEIVLEDRSFILKENIKRGHKIAIKNIKNGEDVIKYGNSIGKLVKNVEEGMHIHTHNLKTNLKDIVEYSYNPTTYIKQNSNELYFNGYVRSNGDVGIRNELWIIPTVGCVNGVVREIEKQSKSYVKENIDGIISFNHPYGCSQIGDDQENTQKIIADLITNPNVGGALVVGLGCENSGINEIKKHLSNYDKNRIRFLNSQDFEDEIEESITIIKELTSIMSQDKRVRVAIDKLKIGLKCGGSDGLSGISANPVVGKVSDLLIDGGGTTVLTEVPEMFGAEKILMDRAINEETFKKIVNLINDFKTYYKKHNQPIYENPSPGNKEGGISTLEDKSLGCVQKSGSSKVVDVLDYGEKLNNNGLNILCAPGNDLVASTALAASGCQIILFTTGRGTPFASPVPTIKISSNTNLYKKKNKWIDFNAGVVLEDKSIDECALDLVNFVVEVANGYKTKSEKCEYHDLAIFKTGVTL